MTRLEILCMFYACLCVCACSKVCDVRCFFVFLCLESFDQAVFTVLLLPGREHEACMILSMRSLDYGNNIYIYIYIYIYIINHHA